jgi:heme-degrading monooxygenase HmoA
MQTMTIQAGAPVLTVINVFTVEKGRQAELVRILEEATDRLVARQPGFVSASLHRSVDGTHVAGYSQWRRVEDFNALRDRPEMQEHMRRIAAFAKFEPVLYEVASVRAVNEAARFEINDANVREGQRRQGMKVRKVVTGHDEKGRAIIARDEKVDGMPIPGIGELAVLWSADEPATYPNAGNNPGGTALFPPVGGLRFVMATYSPGEFVASGDLPEMHIERGDKPGMHRTDSTDFGVVISGNLALDLDNGAEVFLSPGDVVVQNGTRHRWRVVGDVPVILAAFIIGAHRRA